MTDPNQPGQFYPQYPQGSGFGNPQGPGQGPGSMPPPSYSPGPATAGTNTMAILALIFAFVFAPLGIVFGAIGRSQTRKTGQGGRGLATAGLVLGIVFTVLWVATVGSLGVLAANATPTVTQRNVESQISQQLAKAGQTPDSVNCPGSLEGKVGTTMTCTLTADGDTRPVDVTVTSVDGLTVHFMIENPPPIVSRTNVESQISQQLATKAGGPPEAVTCPSELEGRVGTSITCTLTDSGDSRPVDVTVTSVKGANVYFDIAVR